MPLIDLDQANAFETAALPGEGDVSAGAGGLTTSSMTNETDLEAYGLDTYSQSGGHISGSYDPPSGARHIAPGMAQQVHGTAVDHPFWTVALLAAILLTYKGVTKNESTENVKASIPSFVAIGSMSMLWFLGAKWLFGIIQVPSITPTMDFL